MKLVVALAVLVGLLAGGDIYARHAAEVELRARLRERVPEAVSIDASLSSFPFVGRILLNGDITEIKVRATGVRAPTGPLRFAVVDLDAHDVHIDRDQLLSHRRVVLTGAGHGTVTAEVGAPELSAALGIPVTLSAGQVTVDFHGRRITVVVAVRNGALSFETPAGAVATLTIPRTKFVPCVAQADVTATRVRMTCRFDHLPPELIGVAARVST